MADFSEQLADAVALAIKQAITPLIADNAALAARIIALESRPVIHGRDGRDGQPGVKGDIGESGPSGPPGPPGDPGAEGAPGNDGKDGTEGAKGDPGEPGAPGPPGERGADGKDGQDGKDGAQGPPGEPGQIGPMGEKGMDGAPGRDGLNGKDGRDGTLEGWKIVRVDQRTVRVCFKNGDPVEGGELHFPVPLYRGTFKAGTVYEPGDEVTWGGGSWHCVERTTDKPSFEKTVGSRAWVLKTKPGRDGRDGAKGEPGPPGKDGRDWTDVDPKGRKW